MKTYHPHHQICPVWHQVPAHRSARFDLFKDVRLASARGGARAGAVRKRGRHGTTIPVGCQGRDSDTDAVFVTRTQRVEALHPTVPSCGPARASVTACRRPAPQHRRRQDHHGIRERGSVLTKLVPRTSHPLSAPVAGSWIAATRLRGPSPGLRCRARPIAWDFSTSSATSALLVRTSQSVEEAGIPRLASRSPRPCRRVKGVGQGLGSPTFASLDTCAAEGFRERRARPPESCRRRSRWPQTAPRPKQRAGGIVRAALDEPVPADVEV